MRISDWSSDVCSSDLFGDAALEQARTWLQWRYRLIPYVLGAIEDSVRTGLPVQRSMALSFPHDPDAHDWDLQYLLGPALRSAEHPSEPQSLMRISYAVLCLKKKNTSSYHYNDTQHYVRSSSPHAPFVCFHRLN